MLTLGMYQLTHPEVLSEAELREMLETTCIDFNTYKHLSRSKLIELYKRVAMPLPRRQNEGKSQNSDANKNNEEKSLVNELHTNSVSSINVNNTSKNISETTQPFYVTKSKSPVNDHKYISKKSYLCNSNDIKGHDNTDKRVNDEKHEVCIFNMKLR
ncbi:uncharacterized protein LOC122402919 isoform X2 [Colletes gigas]|uniref:uncharacterized protein LOC122402919 isoform X2 n=1 Tax=Colletes gigas TaxID=935657 RepID=UPI001C9B2565|nr:uncharacterized protein LOC122402919 isoform X2 [Colletes gigas]